jgi:lipopolysaccharide export LptBFGC system permease protein LptF
LTYTLYKYIFRELLRVFLLALIALTLILSLGSILQPIQEYGAGPRQVIVFMFYFLPITLTFVLPMAALFAGALVYGRFTSDNELDACRASGISTLNLVIPGLFLAIIVAASNLLLSFYVMPTFVHLAEKSIKADIKQMLFRSIEQNGYYKIPPDNRYLIYADYVDIQNDTLFGVVLTKINGIEIQEIYTTESAKIQIIPHEKTNEVQISTYNTYRMSQKDSGSVGTWVFTKEFGSLLDDDIAFKKVGEMRKIKNDLMLFDPIATAAHDTLVQLMIELSAHDIKNKIAETRNNTNESDNELSGNLYELKGEQNSVKFTLVPCSVLPEQLNLAGEMTITEFETEGGKILHTFSCKEASLRIEGSRNNITLAMDLNSARDIEAGEIQMWHSINGLKFPKTVEKAMKQFYNEDGSINVSKLASGISGVSGFTPTSDLLKQQDGLKRVLKQTIAEINSEIHSRLVFGIGCIFMIMIGISLGIIKRGGHLLSAFGASCVPAAILVVCIMSGKQLAENLSAQTVSGITIMWAGFGALFLLAAALYYHLLRN